MKNWKKYIFWFVFAIVALKLYSLTFPDMTTYGKIFIPHETICDESLVPPIPCN